MRTVAGLTLVLSMLLAGTVVSPANAESPEIPQFCLELPEDEVPCATDLAVAVEPASISVNLGDTFGLTATVTNQGDEIAFDWEYILSVIDAELITHAGTTASRAGATAALCGDNPDWGLSCGSSMLGPGERVTFESRVKATRIGDSELSGFVHTASEDLDDGNDEFYLPLKVKAKGPVGSAACLVPKLKGLTVRAAKRRLAKAGCRLGPVRGAGKLKGKRLMRLRVVASKPKAGKALKRGARVTVRVKR